jgi:sarcosine oxidase
MAGGARGFDAIVIGVGGMGSSICCRLAERGQRVLGLEQFDIANSLGSSHGASRIIRLAYHEGPQYVPLVQRALTLWRELGERVGERLLHVTGSLDIGPAGGGLVAGAGAVCRALGIAHTMLDAGEMRARHPAFRLPEDHAALFQPDGGFVLPERAVIAHVTLAQAAGAEIHGREAVREWAPLAGGGVRVATDRGTYEAGQLIIAAGAWLAHLVPSLARVAVPERQVLGWFQPDDPAAFAPSAFPVSILDVAEGAYYVTPVFGTPGVKIGLHHHRRQQGTAEALSRAVEAEDEALLRACLGRYLPSANGPILAARTCLYTVTPDEHFIIDRLPGEDEVIIVSACSGHGYKFATVIGEIVAGMAAGEAPAFDLGMFRIGRF